MQNNINRSNKTELWICIRPLEFQIWLGLSWMSPASFCSTPSHDCPGEIIMLHLAILSCGLWKICPLYRVIFYTGPPPKKLLLYLTSLNFRSSHIMWVTWPCSCSFDSLLKIISSTNLTCSAFFYHYLKKITWMIIQCNMWPSMEKH